jgi:hypothetical protein
VSVIAVALLASACSGSGHPSALESGRQPTTTTMPPPKRVVPVSATMFLGSRTIQAGSFIHGEVIVENRTRRALQWTACDALFEIVLGNGRIKPTGLWHQCRRSFTIPQGKSRYAVTVTATYQGCSAQSSTVLVTCEPGARVPPLPPGDYNAILFQAGPFVPPPPSIAVVVQV